MLVNEWHENVIGEHGAKANKLRIERTHDGRQNAHHKEAGQQRIVHEHLNHCPEHVVGIAEASKGIVQLIGWQGS